LGIVRKVALGVVEKRERGRIQGLPKVLKYPYTIIPRTGKPTNFKFCTHICRIDRNKSPLKISLKVALGVVSDSRKFSGHPNVVRIARSSLR